jgi:hypothetical protein
VTDFDKKIAEAIAFFNSPVTDREVADVVRRLGSLGDPRGTSKDAATLLERLCGELTEMRELSVGVVESCSGLARWPDGVSNAPSDLT